MKKKLVLAIGLFLLGGISLSRGDGFIVVERPIYVPPSHFPIAPRSRKPIKISYTELLRSDAGTVTYLYPLSTEKFSARPIKNLSMKIELKSGEPLASIYSPSHKVEIKRDGPNRAVIGYESKDEKPDTDFQLVYSSDIRDVGLRLITYKPDTDDGYFLLLAAPT